MLSFGVPYLGSKNRIAAQIVSAMPEAERLVDLFAGGCAVSHAAMMCGRFRSVHMNDLYGGTVRLFLDCLSSPVPVKWVSREEFFARKDEDELVRWCWSFGMDGRTYAFGREKEDAARRAFCSGRYRERVLADIPRRLMRLRDIRRTARFCKATAMSGREDFEAVRIRRGDVVYLDPPYDRAVGYDVSSKVQDFGRDVWEYARRISRICRAVFVSEYCDNAPSDFKRVRTFGIRHLSSPKDTDRPEGLFTPCGVPRDCVY